MRLNPSKVAEAITRIAPRGKLAKRAARAAIRNIVGNGQMRKLQNNGKGSATPAKPPKPA